MFIEETVFIIVLALVMYWLFYWFVKLNPAVNEGVTAKRMARLKTAIGKETPLLAMVGEIGYKSSCRLIRPKQLYSWWQRRAVLITPTRFEVYDLDLRQLIFSFTPEQLQWVGLPDQYQKGFNQFWLHVEKAGEWYILQIQAYKYDNRSLFLALRRFAFDHTDQVGAYQRRRGIFTLARCKRNRQCRTFTARGHWPHTLICI